MMPAAVTGTERNGWERRRDDARGRRAPARGPASDGGGRQGSAEPI
jgi:hypothetical protein